MTALKSLAFTKGAVFIFAFFKYATDCIITESPPNPQINADSGIVSVFKVQVDKIFSPLVLSISPKASAFALSKSPKIIEKRLIIGDKILNLKSKDESI